MPLAGEIVRELHGRVHESQNRHSDSDAQFDLVMGEIMEAHRDGSFRVRDFNFREALQTWASQQEDSRIQQFLKRGEFRAEHGSNNTRIQEAVLDVMVSSQFDKLLGRIVQLGTLEQLQTAPQPLWNLVDKSIRITAGTSTKLFGLHSIGDVVDDPVAELEEVRFYGVAGRTVTIPKAMKKNYAFGITREMFDLDADRLVQSAILNAANILIEHAEKLLIDTIFDFFPTTRRPFKYIEDDTAYATYISTAGSLWLNKILSFVVDGTFTPLAQIEALRESARDPYTGNPIALMGNDIVVTNAGMKRKIEDALGIQRYARDTGAGGNERVEFERSGQSSWSSPVIDYWIRDRAIAYFKSAAGGSLNDANSAIAADGIVVWGDIAAAFGWATQWDTEQVVRSGPNTWEYFNQDILLSVKYLQKATPVIKDPRKVILTRRDNGAGAIP